MIGAPRIKEKQSSRKEKKICINGKIKLIFHFSCAKTNGRRKNGSKIYNYVEKILWVPNYLSGQATGEYEGEKAIQGYAWLLEIKTHFTDWKEIKIKNSTLGRNGI